ncbi:RraA family protein [Duffyella gerundensis]|uniref:RraA family protein n=1 Tax=Duffyella TaxID=3026546 RepID=UPI003F6E0457
MPQATNAFIKRDIQRVEPTWVKQAAEFQAAILADVAGRRGTLHGRIKPVAAGMKIAGPAITVEVRPGDNLAIHAALAIAQPGDVIVVDGKGDLSCALIGEIMSAQAAASGIAGIIIDGAVRDADALSEQTFPVFAAGLNPCGPTKSIAGRVNYPVSVAGVAIQPGDLIIGDVDGVVVLPRESVAALLELAQQKRDYETQRIAAIRTGDIRAPWLEQALFTAGMLSEGEKL